MLSLSKGLIIYGKKVPINPQAIGKLYSWTGDKGCMISECEKHKNQNLVLDDFINGNLSSDSWQ